MGVLRSVIAGLAAAFLALLVWASTKGGAGEAMAFLTGTPWGITTAADLYLGFLLSAVVIWLAEERKAVALLWALPIFVLGNVWTAVWFVVRLPRLAARLKAG